MRDHAPGMKARLPVMLLAAAAVATTAVYWAGLHGPLLFDDYPQLGVLLERNPANWAEWYRAHLYSESGPLHRPVAMLSFIANQVWFGPDLWYWKLTNLIIHWICGALIFAIVRRLYRLLALDESAARWCALAVTALWLLHPIQVSSVLYTVQRMAQLSALFLLAGVWSYLKARCLQIEGRAGARWWFLLGFAVFWPLAVFSKENGILLPALIAAIEWFVLRLQGGAVVRRRQLIGYGLVLVLPALMVLGWSVTHGLAWLDVRYAHRDFTLQQRLLTEARVLWQYAGMLLLPIPGSFSFFHDDVVLSNGWFDPPTTFMAVAGWMGALIWLLGRGRRVPIMALGSAWFLLAHIPESTVIPLEIMYEHRNYLPSLGVLLALVEGVRRIPVRAAWKTLTAVLAVLAVGWHTAVLAGHWSSPQRLYPALFAANPDSPRLVTIMANALAESGQREFALQLLSAFDAPGFVLNRWYIQCAGGQAIPENALNDLARAWKGTVDTYAVSGLIELANAGLDRRCDFSDAAFLELLKSTLERPVYNRVALQKLWMYRAHYEHRLQRIDEAIDSLHRAHALYTDNATPLFLATEWLIAAGRTNAARNQFQEALAAARASPRDYRALIDRIQGDSPLFVPENTLNQ